MAHHPEESVAIRSYDGVNEHLKPVWCGIRNTIAHDQDGIKNSLDRIKAEKKTISFLQERIVKNFDALDALEGIR